MSERQFTLGDVRDRVDELLDEHGEDTPVVTDADGVELPAVHVKDDGERVVFY